MFDNKAVITIRKVCIFTATLLVAVLVFINGMFFKKANAAIMIENSDVLPVSSIDKIAKKLKGSEKYYKYKSKGLKAKAEKQDQNNSKKDENTDNNKKDDGTDNGIKDDNPGQDVKWDDNFTMADLRLMSSIIYCEAGSMSEAARIAVANVILNRARDTKDWGHVSTIYEVIYDTKWGVQFSPINGSLDKALDLYDNLDDYKGTWRYDQMNNCIDSAKKAFSGEKAVPDSFMYFNGNIDASKEKCESKGREYMVIDHHIYFE